ncbi:MAG TPA: hypothetical protein VFR31_09605 [Thermoanaerobaculia bacterium]|nr:hypothetical protein [Thermoanaerobaculia bacterium]
MSASFSLRKDELLLAFLVLLAVPASAGDLRVVLEAEGGVRNDGNYDRIETVDDPGLEGEPEENLARAGFNLRLSYELPRWTLALGYFPSYEWMLDDPDANGTIHRLDLGLDGNLTRRLKMSVRERLLSSPGLDLYQPFLAAEPMALTRRGDQLTHALDMGLEQELSRRTVLLFGAGHTLNTFESDDLSDTETLLARFGVGFRPAEDRRFDLLATAGRYDFGERRVPVGPGAVDLAGHESDIQTLGIGWQQPFFRDGRFRIEAGAFAVDSTQTAEETGWRGALELARQLEVFGWSLGYRHDVSAGVGLGRATEVDNAFAGVSANLGRRLFLGLDANLSRHQGLADDDGVVLPEDDLVESAAGTARFSWGFSNVARLNGGWSRIWQESRVQPFEDLSYSRYFVGLALQVYRTGEEPRDPARQEEMEDDEPDSR